MSVSITQLIVQLVLDAGVHHQDLIVFTTLILLFIYYKATRSINTQSHKALIFDSAFEVPSNFSVDISRGPMPASGEYRDHLSKPTYLSRALMKFLDLSKRYHRILEYPRKKGPLENVIDSGDSRAGQAKVPTGDSSSHLRDSLVQNIREEVHCVSQIEPPEARELEINSQLCSPFFGRLPLEIRLQIYEEVITSSQAFCPVCKTKHIVVCQGPTKQEFPKLLYSLLPILLICRRGYSEAIDVLYSTTTFHIPGLYNIRRFLSTIPESQHENLRSLQLAIRLHPPKFIKPDGALQYRYLPDHPWRLHHLDWLNIWRFLSSLPNLHTLRVTLFRHYQSDPRMFQDYPPNNPDKISAESIFEPMMKVRTTGTFEVELHASIYCRDSLFKKWLIDFESKEDNKEVPFELVRFGKGNKVRELKSVSVIGRRAWHASERNYHKLLENVYEQERWGGPDEQKGEVGSFRSDRWWEDNSSRCGCDYCINVRLAERSGSDEPEF